jgi:polyferredoxin
MMVGAVAGRFICGWLCPFGLVEDLLYKIPFMKKLKKLPGDRWLKLLKYLMLVVLVILMPLFIVDIVGQGEPFFCKYVCPSGTLMAGIRWSLPTRYQSRHRLLYAWKVALLIAIILLSIIVFRPFCRYLCPWELSIPYSTDSLYTNTKSILVNALKAANAAKLASSRYRYLKTPNSPECIRCGECKTACPEGAITSGIKRPCGVKKYEG